MPVIKFKWVEVVTVTLKTETTVVFFVCLVIDAV